MALSKRRLRLLRPASKKEMKSNAFECYVTITMFRGMKKCIRILQIKRIEISCETRGTVIKTEMTKDDINVSNGYRGYVTKTWVCPMGGICVVHGYVTSYIITPPRRDASIAGRPY